MVKKKISIVQRYALWKAHNEKCVYSSESLLFSDLNIDHILPESLLSKPEDFEKIKIEYGLPDNFEINSYYNLVPVKSDLNRKKKDLIFNKNTVLLYLNIACDKYEKVLQIESDFKNKNFTEDKIIIPFLKLVEEEKISRDEFVKFLKNMTSEKIFELRDEIKFQDRILTSTISREDLEDIDTYNQSNLDIEGFGTDGLRLVNELNEEIYVKSCQEFFDAKREGFYSLTTYDMKLESVFNRSCGILSALSKAKIPQKSYLDNPRVGVVDLKLLPISILNSLAPDENKNRAIDIANRKSVQDWVDDNLVQIKSVSQNSIHLEHDLGQILHELLRADFNDDGIEDILLYSYSYAIGSSFGYGDIMILTRDNEREMLRLL